MIQRRTPLKRSTAPLKRSPLRRVSKKQAGKLREYYRLRREFLAKNTHCEIARSDLCKHYSSEVHHSQRRGKYLCATETFVACCRPCHDYAETHLSWARANGYLK